LPCGSKNSRDHPGPYPAVLVLKPYVHARISAKRFGGRAEDYQEIHDFIDSTKSNMPDVRHRALLHSSWGCFIVERVFGTNLENSEGRLVSVRDVAEQHIIDDLGTIPTVEDYLKHLPIQRWFGGRISRKRSITMPRTKP